MSMTLKDLEREALQLSEEERALLINTLSESFTRMEADIEEAWLHEVKQRVSEIRSGKATLIDAEEGMRRIKAILDEAL